MSTRRFHAAHLIVAALLLASAACRQTPDSGGPADGGGTDVPATTPDPTLLVPADEVVSAANDLRQQVPGVEVRFSGYTGEVVSIAGPSLSGPTFEALEPLAPGNGASLEARQQTLTDFIADHRALFHLDDPASELRRSSQPQPDDADDVPRRAVSGLTLDRYFGGVRVLGNHVTGLFDDQGGLHAITSHLLPVEGAQTEPMVSEEGSLDALRSATMKIALETENGPVEASLAAADYLEDPDRLESELAILPLRIGSTDLARSAKEADDRLAYVHRFVKHGRRLQGFVDAISGEVIVLADVTDRIDSAGCSGNEAPWMTCEDNEAWMTGGTSREGMGADEIGVLRKIVFTEYNGASFLGLSGANNPTVDGLPVKWLSPTGALTVENLFERAIRDQLGARGSMCQPSSAGLGAWSEGAALCQPARNRQVAGLVENTLKVLKWWSARGWQGWDGQGSTLRLAIGFRTQEGASWGMEEIAASSLHHMDATPRYADLSIHGRPSVKRTGEQLYLGSSLAIVGHEFTHNVIGATTQLESWGEPGAINEALADLFGMAAAATQDTFPTDGILGADIGFGIRSMRNPNLSRPDPQPSCYRGGRNDQCPEYPALVCFGDPERDRAAKTHRGYCPMVPKHINNGILNKAHALLVDGGRFNGVDVPRLGMNITETVVRFTNEDRLFGSAAGMEQFATTVVWGCKLNLSYLEANTDPVVLCPAFQKAYTAVELLSRPEATVLRVASSRRTSAGASLRVANDTYDPVDTSRLEVSAGIHFSDGIGPLTMLRTLSVTPDYRASGGQLLPGDTATVEVALPAELAAEPWVRVRVDLLGQTHNASWNHLTDTVLPSR